MNLSDLKTPEIIEELSFEEILLRMKETLVAIDSEYTAYLGSDPLMKLMEVAAYRELLLRQRINQAAKANLLAFATGSDLDNLAAFEVHQDSYRYSLQIDFLLRNQINSAQRQRYAPIFNFVNGYFFQLQPWLPPLDSLRHGSVNLL
jgi:hypothetical protein